jgi:hypothetical protein
MFWQRALPPDATPALVSPEGERMVIQLQAEVDRRDALARQVNDAHGQEIARRDQLAYETTRNLEERLQTEIQLRDAIIERLRNQLPLWRKIWARLVRSPI